MQQNLKLTTKEQVMTTYNELRKINCNEFTERKGNLTYLSWTYAIDILLQNDPMATWEFLEPITYNDTMMVRTEVTALGKTLKMQLPVMDNRNNAIKQPDARKISDSQMRCLAKNVACFGIGLYIFAGSDLPSDAIDEETPDLGELANNCVIEINNCKTIDELKQVYGKAYAALSKDKNAVQMIANAKDIRKVELSK
jgi:hypothetical protein